ncbi:uncharacterized protein BX663DRAFT_489610 [Cokeromyces recurvatus]|uniref:uncharacterized protein n=1 Tax=Cokeromyces recurvatus TaxID=90255 RepID=UPI002220D94E|nr:uncharacterized protein BX663DRAFT_489610 [Cokeromyces recurvatus]KAI7899049.1 hypothetical protein BX663DRAFT_489610 [Cokeromyces recurvatus]
MISIASSNNHLDNNHPLYHIPDLSELETVLTINGPLGELLSRMTQWLETAHMTAFSIEQSIIQNEPFLDTPLLNAIITLSKQKMQPLMQRLTEWIDCQHEPLHTATKLQSEWSSLQHYVAFVKQRLDQSSSKNTLRVQMETILAQIDDLSTMIFEFQERRQRQTTQENILVVIDQKVVPLFGEVERVYVRMMQAPPEDPTGVLTRKHQYVQDRWEDLRLDIDELKLELKEDRWLMVFRQIADQLDDMMNGLERAASALNESRTRASEKNFEAKYKCFAPSITNMLMMLGNGISARVSTRNDTTTMQRHGTMLARWQQLKATMEHVRRREFSDSDGSSRLSDRSDSTGSVAPRFYHNRSPLLMQQRWDEHHQQQQQQQPVMSRSKSPYKASPSPLLTEAKSPILRHSPGSPMMIRRTTSPISPSHSKRTTNTIINSRLPEVNVVVGGDDDDDDDDTITTHHFRNTNQKQPTTFYSATPQPHKRSVTPSRRSGTPSMIPRPKTPNKFRPRSSMARITTTTTTTTTATTAPPPLPLPLSSSSHMYRPNPKDPLDVEIAMIINRSPVPIQCSKKHTQDNQVCGKEGE